jgi:protein N-terminal methyltransferase
MEVVSLEPAKVFEECGSSFYLAGAEHWGKQGTTVEDMLGGLAWTNGPDLMFSRSVLDRYVKEHHLGRGSCADVACGIGRISKFLLSKYFKRIDLVDPVGKFVLQAERELTALGINVHKHVCGAQDWEIDENFDCFWLQWTLMFLTDNDCIALLRRCKDHLNPNGIVFVKENTVLSEKREDALWSAEDHSFSRTLSHVCDLCTEAGLRIDFCAPQPLWDPELIPMSCLVLKP